MSALLCPENAPVSQPKTHLRLVQPTARDRYAKDAYWMIEGASGVHCKTYERAADALPDILGIMGWKVVYRPLAGSSIAKTLLYEKKIVVCSNHASKLPAGTCVESAVLFAIAEQYAHIRLHLYSGYPMPGPDQVAEAKEYAAVFLGLTA